MNQLSFTFVNPNAPAGSHRADLELLHLDSSREHSSQELKLAYYVLAQKTHPDVGGDRDRFDAITAAYKRLRTDALERESLCIACGGRGVVQLKTSGFMPKSIECSKCEGSGRGGK